MKKLLATMVIMVMFCGLAYAGGTYYFRDIMWGISPGELPFEIQLKDNDGISRICYFTRKGGENYTFFNSLYAYEISYAFYKDRFYGVSISFSDHRNYTNAIVSLRDLLGTEGYGEERGETKLYVWNKGDTKVELIDFGIGNTFFLNITSIPLLNEWEQIEKPRIKQEQMRNSGM